MLHEPKTKTHKNKQKIVIMAGKDGKTCLATV